MYAAPTIVLKLCTLGFGVLVRLPCDWTFNTHRNSTVRGLYISRVEVGQSSPGRVVPTSPRRSLAWSVQSLAQSGPWEGLERPRAGEHRVDVIVSPGAVAAVAGPSGAVGPIRRVMLLEGDATAPHAGRAGCAGCALGPWYGPLVNSGKTSFTFSN